MTEQHTAGGLDFEALRRAIEHSDAESLTSFYAEDALPLHNIQHVGHLLARAAHMQKKSVKAMEEILNRALYLFV